MHIWIIHIKIKPHHYCSTSSCLPYWVGKQRNSPTNNKQPKYNLSMWRLCKWPNHTHADLITGKWKEPVHKEKTPQACKWTCSIAPESTFYSWNGNNKTYCLETLLKKSFPSKSILHSQIPVFNAMKQPIHQNLNFLTKVLCQALANCINFQLPL